MVVASWCIIAFAVVATLYVGADLLIPIALALLLSFVLSPLISLAKRMRVPRPLAVAVAVMLAFGIITGLTAILAGQVGQLAGDLPRYQSTMRDKIQSLRGWTFGSGTLERAADMLQSLGKEFDAPAGGKTVRPGEPSQARPPDAPTLVEVREPPRSALQNLSDIAGPLLHPLATVGIILVFVIFILLEREDLRNRLMSLAGARDIQRTTAAIDDAARRLSRLFLTQLALNAGFGLTIGVGLWIIGVPSPALWGVVAAVLRFVPYIGAVIAAVFPLALAAAVDPGWTMLIATAALFAVVEPIVGHVIEPLIYGRSTGLSPVGVIMSATFWTALWGPVGLVLATPLTVCLVVLGRHVESLAFLDTMFGDRPALTPAELFYQRMLARDPAEAAEKAEEFLRERSLSAYYEEVALPGLLLAQRDAERGALKGDRLAALKASVSELVDDLEAYADADPTVPSPTGDPEMQVALDGAEKSEAEAQKGWTLPRPRFMSPGTGPALAAPGADKPIETTDPSAVVCVGGRTPIDQAAALIVAQILVKNGVAARLFERDEAGAGSVWCAVCLEPTEAHIRLAVRRIRRRATKAEIVVARWRTAAAPAVVAAPTRADRDPSVQANAVTRSLRETVEVCRAAKTRAANAAAGPVEALPA
ncbi:AI-2E family transporter [Chelatococcus sambhunathii]|uniref:AI-2E family transporter n=1 Tax=Chelatococcus sambhunathii TaxID=363953 RepID=A0ABU1DCI2_9HYPH|nr:AI-2E family transporter [Chelatococcus sambhunathii]MDR4305749.1 AI-2E family transporter [Chelatococcus sambhunathii]